MRILQFEDIHDALEGKLIEIKAVAHVIVRRYGFGVVVDHDAAVAFLADGVQRLHAAPVELHRGTDAVRTRTEYDDGFTVAQVMHVVGDAAVRQVQIVGTGGIFGSKGVYLFHYGQNACMLAQGTYGKDGVLTVHIPFQAESAGYLEIGETLYLGPVQQFPRGFVIQEGVKHPFTLHGFRRTFTLCGFRFILHLFRIFVQRPAGVHYIHQLFKEPAVYLCQRVHLVYGISGTEGLGDNEDTLVGRLAQRLIYVGDNKLPVLHEAVHPLSYHAQPLLNGFFKSTSDSHDLAHGLHARTQFLIYAMKLAQIPTGNLADHIVQCRLEECAGGLGYGVLQFEKAVAQS